MLPSTLERKKKKGLLGKLKKFAKSSRSIDDDSDTFPLGSASQVLENFRHSFHVCKYNFVRLNF